jgi:site-specific DNA recombinase
VSGAKSYACRAKQHVSRREAAVDEVVKVAIVQRLMRPDVLLADEQGGEDSAAARAEAAEKRAGLEGFYDAAAGGELTPAALARIEARLLPEIESAERRARPRTTSPLVQDTAGPAAAAWQRLTTEQRREVVDLLCEVRIHPAGRGKRIFDPGTVEIA